MEEQQVFTLGLGLTPPWKVVSQHLDMDKEPHELSLELAADRGSLFPCPECGKACKAHDFKKLTWLRIPVNATPDSGGTRHPIPVEVDTPHGGV